MGPTTVRDGLGRLVDTLTDPVSLATAGASRSVKMFRSGVTAVDARANADPFLRALSEATDPYATLRSAYLQTRSQAVATARGPPASLPAFEPPAVESAASEPPGDDPVMVEP